MGTIEKRGKNSWRIGTQVQTENGWEWVRDTIHLPGTMSEAKQRKEAEKALARLIVDVEEGRAKPTSAKSYTVAAFAEYWMEQHVKPNLAANTYKNYRHFLDARILPMLGNVPLKKLTPTMLTEWVNQVRESPRRTTALPDEKLAHPRRPSEEARRAKAKPKDASTICGIRMPPYCWRITLTPWPSPHAWAMPMPASRCAYTPTRCAAAMKMQRRPRKACLIAPSWGKNWGIKKNSGAPFPARRLRSAPVRDAFFSPKLPQFSPNSLIARWKSRVFDAL